MRSLLKSALLGFVCAAVVATCAVNVLVPRDDSPAVNALTAECAALRHSRDDDRAELLAVHRQNEKLAQAVADAAVAKMSERAEWEREERERLQVDCLRLRADLDAAQRAIEAQKLDLDTLRRGVQFGPRAVDVSPEDMIPPQTLPIPEAR